MTEEQGVELKKILWIWMRDNPRISRHTVYLSELIEFDGSFIVVELSRFNNSYLERHVIGKVGTYANNFITSLEPILKRFLVKYAIEKMEFGILFKFGFELKKYIEVKSN